MYPNSANIHKVNSITKYTIKNTKVSFITFCKVIGELYINWKVVETAIESTIYEINKETKLADNRKVRKPIRYALLPVSIEII